MDSSDCFYRRYRSGWRWARRQSRPTGRHGHWHRSIQELRPWPNDQSCCTSWCPTTAAIGLLVNPTNPPGKQYPKRLAAARTIKRTLHKLEGTTERDLEAAFASFARLMLVP